MAFVAEINRFKHTIPAKGTTTYSKILSHYTGKKLNVYTSARESLLTNPVQKSDSKIDCFLKVEKFNATVLEEKPPRVIQGRNPRYNLELMTYLKPFEHWYYNSSKHIVKGKNMEERAVVIGNLNGCYRGNLDCSKFDSHVSVSALQLEHGCYLKMHKNNRELQRLLSWQLRNFGCTPHGFRYKTEGRRASGDFNTGLGNTLLCEHLFKAFLRHNRIKADFALDGDDLIFASNTNIDPGLIRQFYLACGFEITLEMQVEESMVHCQTSRILTNPPIMVRRPWDVISKALSSQKYLWNKETGHAYLNQVGRCEQAMNRGVPVLESFANMLVRNHRANYKREFSDEFAYRQKESAKLERRNLIITSDARVSFELAFGITTDEQRLLEALFDATKVPLDF